MTDRDGQRRGWGPRRRDRAEWTTFAASLFVVGGLVAVIIGLWVTGTTAPLISITTTGPPVAEDGRFVVHARVDNRGDSTAAEVQVTATLSVDGTEVSDAEQILDFLSGGASSRVAFVLDEDPSRGQLELKVASYQDP